MLISGLLRPPFTERGRFPFPSFIACALSAVGLCLLAAPQAARAQLAPGPYEILPFDDAGIIEGFKDLDATADYIADWTGWSEPVGDLFVISPHAYDDHSGTDFSMQTGTPLRAAAAGTVTATETRYARDEINSTSGNFVRIAVDNLAPNGESLDLTYCHMLSVSVTNGQHVNVGDLIGPSDNNGMSDSEHLHFESELRGGSATCPFYWAHFKYPILFNPTGTMQVGHVLKVTAASTPIRTDRYDTSDQITTAWQNQLYFSAYPKRGYYQVFIPNNGSHRAGFIRATDVAEVFTGTVLQPLPDTGTYVHSTQLAAKYSLRAAPSDAAAQTGQILFGGGRFVADQFTNGYYRIPLPGAAATWAWVKPTSRLVVYPQLVNPAFNLALRPDNDFPIRNAFTNVTNPAMFGRPKFKRSEVKFFSPAAPGGDGNVLFVTDQGNHGTGSTESVLVGKPGHRNYYVQCDVYFNYLGSGVNGFERYGVFLRDDGFAGMDSDYEGAGNCYALLYDTDDGRLRACKLVEADYIDFFPTKQYITSSGWHTLRIEARDTQIKYFLDGNFLIQVNDATFPCGQCGVGYSTHRSDWPTDRGACFDNFMADTLDVIPPKFTSVNLQPDGRVHMWLTGNIGSTVAVDRASILTNWNFFTNLVQTNSTIEFSDTTNAASRFYRARRLQ